jgi:hypothetical protein
MHKTALVAFLASMIWTRPSVADGFLLGRDLMDFCRNTEHSAQQICKGYIVGTYDTILMFQEISVVQKNICLPSRTKLADIVEVAKSYLVKNASKSSYSASSLVLTALKERYQCQK